MWVVTVDSQRGVGAPTSYTQITWHLRAQLFPAKFKQLCRLKFSESSISSVDSFAVNGLIMFKVM